MARFVSSVSVALFLLTVFPRLAAGQGSGAGAGAAEPRKLEISGGLSFHSGEEKTRGFNTTIGFVQPVQSKTKFTVDLNRQYSQITRPHVEVESDHYQIAVGARHDVAKFVTAHVRTEYEHNFSLGMDRNIIQRAGAGLHLTRDAHNIDFLLTADFTFDDEKLAAHTTPEGWKAGYGFFQQTTMNLSKRADISGRFEYKREIARPENELEFQGTLHLGLSRTVGVQVQFNFEYETKVGGPHTKHYEDTTLISLAYRLGGS